MHFRLPEFPRTNFGNLRCNFHWCYTFCTGVTLLELLLHLNCTALSQSASSNFFMYINMYVNELWNGSLGINMFHTVKT